MDLLHALALALIQGITEFLPISSSAHLILPFEVLGWPDQGLAFDVAVHLGSLVAVVLYFRHDLLTLVAQSWTALRSGRSNEDARFALNLLIASAPLVPAGLLMKDIVANELRSVDVIVATTILFAMVLLLADRVGSLERPSHGLTWRHALLIGLAQCLALIPGTSRSGITMTMGLLVGYTREAASRISFLLSIPAIAGAATLSSYDLAVSPAPVDWAGLITGFVISGIAAYICIALFLDFINQLGFLPFVLYRLLLGLVLLALFI